MTTLDGSSTSPLANHSYTKYECINRVDTPAKHVPPFHPFPSPPSSHAPQKLGTLRPQSELHVQPQHPRRIHVGSQAVHIYANPHPSYLFPTTDSRSTTFYSNSTPHGDPEPFDWRPVYRPTDRYFIERRKKEKARQKKHRKYAGIGISVMLACVVVLTVVLSLVFKYRNDKAEGGKGGVSWNNKTAFW
jgi:hypothetical protein